MVEIHGSFDPTAEVTTKSYAAVSSVKTLRSDSLYTVVEIELNHKNLQVMQSNSNFDANTKHNISLEGDSFNWTGPYAVKYDNKTIK